jgi:hypothetical protein
MSSLSLTSHPDLYLLCPHHTAHKSPPPRSPIESQTTCRRRKTCSLGPLLRCRCLRYRADMRPAPRLPGWKSTCRKCTPPSIMSRPLLQRICLRSADMDQHTETNHFTTSSGAKSHVVACTSLVVNHAGASSNKRPCIPAACIYSGGAPPEFRRNLIQSVENVPA